MKTQPTSEINTENASSISGIEVRVTANERYPKILTARALEFLVKLARTFDRRRQELLEARKVR